MDDLNVTDKDVINPVLHTHKKVDPVSGKILYIGFPHKISLNHQNSQIKKEHQNTLQIDIRYRRTNGGTHL